MERKPLVKRWWRIRITAIGLGLVTTFLLLEVALRLLPSFAREPLRSLVLEAGRIPLSNRRILPGGVQIFLPVLQHADILVVGDSFPFGTYVDGKHTFPSRLAERLQVMVANLAVASQSPPAYNRMLEIGSRYHPKLVLYCLFANDFNYGSEFEARSISSENANKTLPGDAELFVTEPSAQQRLGIALRHLTNLSLSYQLYKLLQQPAQKVPSVEWRKDVIYFKFAGRGYWDNWVGWQTPQVQEGTRFNVRLMAQAFQRVHGLASHLLVVLQPSKEMVYAPFVGDLAASIYDESHYETYVRVAEMLGREHIPYVDLTPELRRVAAESPQPLYHAIDGHWNERGHDEVARILASYIQKELM